MVRRPFPLGKHRQATWVISAGIIGIVIGWVRLAGIFDVDFVDLTLGFVAVRLALWRTGYFPLHSSSFLDYAVERMLLRKVGNRYIFLHRTLLDYFASLPSSDTEDGHVV